MDCGMAWRLALNTQMELDLDFFEGMCCLFRSYRSSAGCSVATRWLRRWPTSVPSRCQQQHQTATGRLPPNSYIKRHATINHKLRVLCSAEKSFAIRSEPNSSAEPNIRSVTTGGPPLTQKSLTWFPLPRFLAYVTSESQKTLPSTVMYNNCAWLGFL